MHKLFQKFNPFRDPAWRYERCLKLVEHRPRPLPASAKRDDEHIRRYRKFLLRYLSTDDEDERNALFPYDPELFYAHLIHHHPDREWRTIAQARILATQSDDEIAHNSGTLPGVIDLYEKLFFNVRDRLDTKDWIVKTVLGTAAQRAANRYDSTTDHQRDMLYKLFGYFGGPIILDVVVSGFAQRDFPTDARHVAGWFDRTMKGLVKRKAALEAARFEVDKFKVMELLHIHLSIITAERDSGGGPQSDYEKSVAAMLGQTPWGLAKKGYDALNDQQKLYALSHIEPRADEQLQLATGIMPDTLRDREQYTDVKLLTVNAVEED